MAEFYGTNGRDIIVGTDDDDFIWGGAGGDTLRGGLGNDQIGGEAGNDSLEGGDGHDRLRGGAGVDQLAGGAGTDTAIYSGALSNYQVRTVNGTTTVRDLRPALNGGEGTDTLVGVERIHLGDGTVIFLTPNQAPVAADDSFSVAEDGTASGNLFGNDSDADGDSFSVSAVNGDAAMVGNEITLGSGALLTLNLDGSYTYDANGAFESLDDGETRSDSFQYTIDDGFGGTSTATVTITVTGADDQPTITAIDAGRVSEDAAAVTIDLVSTASDVDGDTVSLVSGSIALSSSNSGRTLSGTVAGNSLVIDPAQFNDLDDGESETITVSYSVTDGDGDAVVNTITLVVTGADDQPTAPVDSNPVDSELAEDAAVGTAVGITASATDPDDTVEYYFRDADGNRVQTLGNFTIDAVTGVVTLAAALDYEEAASHTLMICAGDGTDESSSNFTINVTDVDELAPISMAATNIVYDHDSVAFDINTNEAGTARIYINGSSTPIEVAVIAGANPVSLEGLTPNTAYSIAYTVTDAAGNVSNTINESVTTAKSPVPTPGDDEIYGTDGDDIIDALAGNDIVNGLAGNDTITGGTGDDTLDGGEGNDTFVLTGAGNDAIAGGGGFNTIDLSQFGARVSIGAASATTVIGSDYSTTIFTATDVARIIGTNFSDGITFGTSYTRSVTVEGGRGNDVLQGGAAVDSLNGGADSDFLTGRQGGDVLTGGQGSDTFNYENADEGGDIITDFNVSEDVISFRYFDSNVAVGGTQGWYFSGSSYRSDLSSTGQLVLIANADGTYTLTAYLADGDAISDMQVTLNASVTASNFVGVTAAPPPPPVISIDDQTVDEGAGTMTFTVSRTGDLSAASTVDWFLWSGTAGLDDATAGQGYGTIEFAAGVATQTITVTINDDSLVEGQEAFGITIYNATNGTFAYSDFDQGVGTITDNDVPPPPATEGDDNLTGTAGDDTIDLLGGNDTYDGLGGNDVITGGSGNDAVIASIGTDRFDGGADFDTIDFRNANNAVILLGGVSVTLDGVSGFRQANVANSVTYLREVEQVLGGYAADSLDLYGVTTGMRVDGREGNDWIRGGSGSDTLIGSNGDDELDGGGGNDAIDGGADTDKAALSGVRSDYTFVNNADGTVTVTDSRTNGDGVDTLTSIENIRFLGDDTTVTLASLLSLVPTEGDNTLAGTEGNDGSASSYIDLLGGNDTYYALGGDDYVRGGIGNDTIHGGKGANFLDGGLGDDTFVLANDIYDSAYGVMADTVTGGEGLDTIEFDPATVIGREVVIDPTNSSRDQIWATNASGTYWHVGYATSVESYIGTQHKDTFNFGASTVARTVDGGANDDVIFGSKGNDTLIGGAGRDQIVGGLGTDELRGGSEGDTFSYYSVLESNVGSYDQILDFESGLDKIDLSSIDANSLAADNQAFHFIGDAAFTRVAGQLRFETSNDVTTVQGDTDGDGVADFMFTMNATPLTSSDFVF